MTDPVLRLETTQLTAEPGGQARAEITVLNPGTIVESYALDVVGEQPLPWAEVTPAVLSIYPQQQETATVVFNPPSGPTGPAGTVPFGIRARSQVDPSNSAVVEGQLEIGQVFGLQSKLTPVTSSGRWSGRHTIQFSNWGNSPARLKIVASDPDQALGFLIRPDVVDVPLGSTVTARIKARTRRPVLRGSTSRLPFKVVGEPDPPRPFGVPAAGGADPSRPVADGAFTQKPILTRGVVTAAAVVGAALIGVLAFALTRGGATEAEHGDKKTLPEKPVLSAKATGPNSIGLAWAKLTNIDSYAIHYVDQSDQIFKTDRGIDATNTAHNVEGLNASTPYCFKLSAVNGKLEGPPSNKVCTTTAKAPATPVSSTTPSGEPSGGPSSATPGGPTSTPPASEGTPTGQPSVPVGPDTPAFKPGEWIVAIEIYEEAFGNAEQSAEAVSTQLTAGGVEAKVLHHTGPQQYPGMVKADNKTPLNEAWVVYLGPGASPDQLRTICQSRKVQEIHKSLGCLTRQPAMAPPG